MEAWPAGDLSPDSGDCDLWSCANNRQSFLRSERDRCVGLTGTKKGCDHGQCGACTFSLPFWPVYPFRLSLVYPSDQSDEDSGVGALGLDRELNLWRRLA
jgi:hypothetical protein